MYKKTFAMVVGSLVAVGSANASAVLEVVGATAHNGGNWPSTLGHISDSVNGNGSNTLGTADHNPQMTIVDPANPATWQNNTGTWQSEWLADGRLDPTTSANDKIGYFIVDFGSVIEDLEDMFLWSARRNSPGEDVRLYNLYYSSGNGIDALPAMPNSRSWANGSAANADYDFGNGDWAPIATPGALPSPSSPYTPDHIVSLGGVSARYIGIEIITAENTDPNDRVGFGHVEFTAIPTPGAAVMAFAGLAGFAVRRRRG